MESRKSPKLAQTSQEMSRSPRLPKKPPVRSPSLTRREFPVDGFSEVLTSYYEAKYGDSFIILAKNLYEVFLFIASVYCTMSSDDTSFCLIS